MYMKTEHARHTACPMSLSRDESSLCGANDCMAWRWKPEPNPKWKPRAFALTEDGTDYRHEPQPYIESEDEGYCGMAVRPTILEGV